MTTKWTVGAMKKDDAFGPRQYFHEDGYYNDYSADAVVIAYNTYGNEYVHKHVFESLDIAERFVLRVNRHLEADGELDLTHWVFNRVQYGSQAYIDEEPYIVEREKQDALDQEFFKYVR